MFPDAKKILLNFFIISTRLLPTCPYPVNTSLSAAGWRSTSRIRKWWVPGRYRTVENVVVALVNISSRPVGGRTHFTPLFLSKQLFYFKINFLIIFWNFFTFLFESHFYFFWVKFRNYFCPKSKKFGLNFIPVFLYKKRQCCFLIKKLNFFFCFSARACVQVPPLHLPLHWVRPQAGRWRRGDPCQHCPQVDILRLKTTLVWVINS